MGDDYVLNFRIGDLVTRISHEHDILFRIINFGYKNIKISIYYAC